MTSRNPTNQTTKASAFFTKSPTSNQFIEHNSFKIQNLQYPVPNYPKNSKFVDNNQNFPTEYLPIFPENRDTHANIQNSPENRNPQDGLLGSARKIKISRHPPPDFPGKIRTPKSPDHITENLTQLIVPMKAGVPSRGLCQKSEGRGVYN